MRLSGSLAVGRPRQAVWDALRDPDVLGRTLPGCDALEITGPDTYSVTLTTGVASLAGTYRGTVEVVEAADPESYRLTLQGAGEPGTVRADALVRLEEDGERTIVRYTADAIVDGIIAEVGQRLVAGVVQRTAGEFFAAVGRELTAGPGAPASQPTQADVPDVVDGKDPPVRTDRGPQGRVAEGIGRRRPLELFVAALVGAAAALVAVLAGRRTSGRSH